MVSSKNARRSVGIGVGLGLLGMVLGGAVTEAFAQGGWTDDGTVVRLTTKTDGVGIGTATPIDKLHVIGNVRASGNVVTEIIAAPGATILHLRVGGRDAFRLDPTYAAANIIGGYEGNAVDPAVVGGTIAGGGHPISGGEGPFPNIVTDNFGAIGGGLFNQAGDAAGTVDDARAATVGGGESNLASGKYSTIGGGLRNAATGLDSTVGGGGGNHADGPGSTVAGGGNNHATGGTSAIGGGESNSADGTYSTIAGGIFNVAAGTASFAAGTRAKANHQGAFVWADWSAPDFASGAANQFRVRSTGGAQFVSAVDLVSGNFTAGVTLPAGGNSWGSISDRALKENITRVDGHEILRRLSAIDITRWNLKAQDPSIKHLGPMAQDFYAAFGLGEDERYINSADADGVALVSIQALYRMMTALEQKTAALEQQSADLVRIADSVEELRARLAHFERAAASAR